MKSTPSHSRDGCCWPKPWFTFLKPAWNTWISTTPRANLLFAATTSSTANSRWPVMARPSGRPTLRIWPTASVNSRSQHGTTCGKPSTPPVPPSQIGQPPPPLPAGKSSVTWAAFSWNTRTPWSPSKPVKSARRSRSREAKSKKPSTPACSSSPRGEGSTGKP